MAQDPRDRLRDERIKLENMDRQIEELATKRATLLLTDIDAVDKIDSELVKQSTKRAARFDLIALLEVEGAKLDAQGAAAARQKAVDEVVAPAAAQVVRDAKALQATILELVDGYQRLIDRCTALRRDRPAAVPAPQRADLRVHDVLEQMFRTYPNSSVESFIGALAHKAKSLHAEVVKRADAYVAECRDGMTLRDFCERFNLPVPKVAVPVLEEEEEIADEIAIAEELDAA
jgi:hypothetical protein